MTMQFIASQTVGASPVGIISFTSIPQTFTHLQLRTFARANFNPGGNTAGSVYFYFNSDTTGANYQNHFVRGDGASVSSGANLNVGLITLTATIPLLNATSNVFGVNIVDILDYTNTSKNKVTRSIGGYDQNVTTSNAAFAAMNSGLWISTAAINRIDLATDQNFIQHCRFDLYGITTSAVTGA